jgi:hypothetical protein
MNRGKFVIVAIVAVAMLAAVFSTWYHYRAQHRAQDFWGTRTALLIAEAPQVEALELDDLEPIPTDDIPTGNAPVENKADDKGDDKAEEKADDAAEPATTRAVTFGGMAWQVLAHNDVDKAPGISNLRRALLTDITFDWREHPGLEDPTWRYALVFNNGRDLATVLFDPDSDQVALTDGKKTALLDPAASDDFLEFFRERFPSPAPLESKESAEKSADKTDDKTPEQPASTSPSAGETEKPPAGAPAEEKPAAPAERP